MSLFAGAIWRAGGFAFEEFSEIKLKRPSKKESPGRIDLWFTVSGHEFRAEAKAAEIPITREAQQLKRLRALVKRAVLDAGDNPADGGNSRRLAIAFATPYFNAKLDDARKRDRLSWFRSLADQVDHDAIAWYFPSGAKLPVAGKNQSPGIVIWIKLVKRAP